MGYCNFFFYGMFFSKYIFLPTRVPPTFKKLCFEIFPKNINNETNTPI